MRKLFLIAFIFYNSSTFSQPKKLEQLIKISDSLELQENYKDAIDFWKKNQAEAPELSKHYIDYFSYWNDAEKQSLNQIIHIEKALLRVPNRDKFETNLLLKIFSQHYHHIAELGDWEKVLEKALEGYALKDFNQAKDKTKTDYLYDIGYVYSNTGNYFEAINFYNKSLSLYITQFGEIDNEVALNYNNLAFNYGEVGNSKKSLQFYEKAAAIWQKVYNEKEDKNNYLITVYNNLVDGYVAYGDFEKAKQSLSKLNKVFDTKYKNPSSHKEINYWSAKKNYVLSNIRVLVQCNKIAEAENMIKAFVDESQFSIKNQDNEVYLLQCYTEIINSLYEKERYKEMGTISFEALKIAEKYQKKHYLMIINSFLAKSYLKKKQYQLASNHIQIALDNNLRTNYNTSEYSLNAMKAFTLQKLNNNNDAIKLAKQNIEKIVFDNSKKKIKIETLRFEDVKELVSQSFMGIFYKSGRIYLNQFLLSKNKKNLEIAENLYKIAANLFQEYYLKGEFNDELTNYHSAINEGLLDCLILKNANLKDKIALINEIERNASQHLIKEFDRKLKRTNSKNSALIDNLNSLKAERNYYINQKKESKNTEKIVALEKEIKNITQQISLTEKNFSSFTNSNFDINEVISKLKSEEQILKYYVCEDAIYVVSLLKNDIQIKKIDQKEKWGNTVSTYINQIKKIALEPTSKTNNLYAVLMPFKLKNKITIIPDSFLNYLPFETLFDAKTKKYVVENHIVSYDYSLPLWLLHLQNKETNYNQSLAVFSPFYNQKTGDKRSDFKDLKFAKQESQQIAALFDGTLFAKEKATKTNFINQKENFDIFHLSMHSRLFEDDFNKSCLLFSNEERLFFSDLYGMNIPASMVVLSACDTGNGILKNGEGIMSMSRALTYAGVKSAVVSLWQVPDKETSEIMISFYENLKKGQAKDEALANAKRLFLQKNPMKNHPFYWAGFVVNGDVSPIMSNNIWLIYFGSGIGIVILLLVCRKKLFQLFQ